MGGLLGGEGKVRGGGLTEVGKTICHTPGIIGGAIVVLDTNTSQQRSSYRITL